MTNPIPRVTLCLPTVGHLEFFAGVQRSVAGQSYRDLEVLVLDNASPPASRDALIEWARTDPRIRILRAETRLGMFENFNRGIAAARGEYLAFFHDDDEFLPGYVEACLRFMDAHPRVAFCGVSNVVMDVRGNDLLRREPVRRDTEWAGKEYIARLLRAGRNPLAMPTIFYRRSAIPPEGLDLSLSPHFGDFVFLMRLAESGRVGALCASLARIRRHGGQASASMGRSAAIPIRTRTLLGYVDEYRARHPEERRFLRTMARAVALSRRTGLLWGWLTAQDEGEARACASQLDGSGFERRLKSVLSALAWPTHRVARPRARWPGSTDDASPTCSECDLVQMVALRTYATFAHLVRSSGVEMNLGRVSRIPTLGLQS